MAMKNILLLLLFVCSFVANSQNSPFIVNNTTGQSVTKMTSNIGYGAQLNFQRFTNTSNYYAFETGAGSFDDLRLHVNNNWSSPIMSFKPDGTVGIGTALPGAQLDIKSSSVFLNFTTSRGFSTARNWGFVTSWVAEGDFAILQSTTNANSPSVNRFIIDPNGNVGIGTPSPSCRLDVAGSLGTTGLSISNTTGNSQISFKNIGSLDWDLGTQVGEATQNFNLYNRGTSSVALSINKSSNYIGIGTTSPAFKFHVSAVDASVQQRFQRTGTSLGITDVGADDQGFKFFVGGFSATSLKVLFGSNGRVGIGTFSADATLTVNGDIHSKEVRVDTNIPTPDYVFEKDYKLSSLEDIKTYIDQNKHLPEVPSAAAMEKNGIQLGEMNMLLLKKIEELTLYVIEQKEEVKNLKSMNAKLEYKLNNLETALLNKK